MRRITRVRDLKHKDDVTCMIAGVIVHRGKICVDKDGVRYICQDRANGDVAPDLFGYKYSWSLTDGFSVNNVSDVFLLDEGDINNIIWNAEDLNYGDRVTCFINETYIEDGMIYVEPESQTRYICQNEVLGTSCADKMGYKYSWSLAGGLERNHVHQVRLYDDSYSVF